MEINNIEEANEFLKDFVFKHDLTLKKKGEVGFGRPCVGILRGNCYVEYNPYEDKTYEPIKEFYNEDISKFSSYNSYHKHSCFAVLVEDGDYNNGLIELAKWLSKINDKYEIKFVDKENKCKDALNYILNGTFKTIIKLKKKKFTKLNKKVEE